MNNPQQVSRYYFLDKLKIFLCFLVVLHHWAIAHGAPGDWYTSEHNLSFIQEALLSIFVATNQSFFMGLFFFISAYFVPVSLKKQGGRTFLKKKLQRLGIPLLIYVFVLSPLIKLSIFAFQNEVTLLSISKFLSHSNAFAPGPLWFLLCLLIFHFLFVATNKYILSIRPETSPGKLSIFGLIYILSFGTIFIRLLFPVGYWIPVLQIQPAHLLQYAIFYLIGIFAQTSNFDFGRINNYKWLYFGLAQILILVTLPLILLYAESSNSIPDLFGGSSTLAIVFASWEQSTAVVLSLGLLGIFHHYFNSSNAFAKDISQHSYGIFFIHSAVLVAISLCFHFFQGNSFAKFLVLSPISLILSYLTAKLIRKNKLIRRIL